MILSKAGRYSLLAGLLCLLLMAFAGASYGAIRWQVVSAPTEVIYNGRSEVLGSISLIVDPGQTPSGTVVTGNVSGGPAQIAILYDSPLLQIDNMPTSGIRAGIYRQVVSGGVFVTTRLYDFVGSSAIDVRNIDLSNGLYAGQITLSIPVAMTLNDNDFIRVDGVRGRIDKTNLNPDSNYGARLQSINDPSANQFVPTDTPRVALSYAPFTVSVTKATATLCLPSWGDPTGAGGYIHQSTVGIQVKERFNRAFVAKDSNTAGGDSTDRLDSNAQILGGPSNGTMLKLILNNIPASVTAVSWPSPVSSGSGFFALTSGTVTAAATQSVCTGTGYGTCFFAATAGAVAPPAGVATAVYEYFTSNQAGASDANLETFNFLPELLISATNQQDVPTATYGGVRAGVSLWPWVETITGLIQPYGTASTTYLAGSATVPGTGSAPMPRFVTIFLSTSDVSSPTGVDTTALTTFGLYEDFSRCVCYMLYPYVTYTPPNAAVTPINRAAALQDFGWNTGISVSNTSDDSGAITSGKGAANQAGIVQFWLYDYRYGNLTAGLAANATGVVLPETGHVPTPGNSGAGYDTVTSGGIYYAGQTLRLLASQLVANLPSGNRLATAGMSDFSGYIIAKANFQYCHGIAYVADGAFSTIAQGYVASIIPDPTTKGRLAAAAGDPTNRILGESLNN